MENVITLIGLLFLFCLPLYFVFEERLRSPCNGNHFSSIYIYVQFFFVLERTRDLIYLKFVATDFFPKIISPSAGENSGDLA